MVLFPHQMPSAFALGLSWPLLDPKSGTTGTPKQTPNLIPKTTTKNEQQMSPTSVSHLELPGLVFVSSWAILDQPRATWSYLGAILGSCWALLGCLGPAWGQRGASLGQPGAGLGPAWGQLGLVWGDLGPAWASLAFLGTILQPFWRHLEGIFRPFWEKMGHP